MSNILGALYYGGAFFMGSLNHTGYKKYPL